jgi:hypothetical protein
MLLGIVDTHRSAEHDETGKLIETRHGIPAVEVTAIELQPVPVRLRGDESGTLERNVL